MQKKKNWIEPYEKKLNLTKLLNTSDLVWTELIFIEMVHFGSIFFTPSYSTIRKNRA